MKKNFRPQRDLSRSKTAATIVLISDFFRSYNTVCSFHTSFHLSAFTQWKGIHSLVADRKQRSNYLIICKQLYRAWSVLPFGQGVWFKGQEVRFVYFSTHLGLV